jgi:hypothetical protein
VNISANPDWRSRRKCALAFYLLVLLAAPLCSAQAPPSTESQVKAAYLYNFGKFVTWPASGGEFFDICILGKDPFGPILDATVTGERIDGKKITVHRISRVQEGAGCNVLFISSSEEGRLPAILVEAQRMHVLTVSDMPHFAERGGIIGLVNQQGRVRFEVNLKMAEQTPLLLSSELLKVAIRVIQSKPAGT